MNQVPLFIKLLKIFKTNKKEFSPLIKILKIIILVKKIKIQARFLIRSKHKIINNKLKKKIKIVKFLNKIIPKIINKIQIKLIKLMMNKFTQYINNKIKNIKFFKTHHIIHNKYQKAIIKFVSLIKKLI